jgi:hypothetical protein
MAAIPRDRTTPLEATGNTVCDQEQRKPIVQQHPQYRCRRDDYILIEDCLYGERRIKDKETEYLPKTSAQEEDDPQGKAYESYLTRAIYYNYPLDTVETAVGMMQREPSEFIVPETMEKLLTSSTIEDEPLSELLSDVNTGQVSYGGLCLLVDIPVGSTAENDNDMPYFVKYDRVKFINWSEDVKYGRKRLRMVLLDESKNEIGPGGAHQWVWRYRVCALDENDRYWTAIVTDLGGLDMDNFNPPSGMGDEVYPTFRGTELNYIPFVPINVSNLQTKPQTPPVLDIANLSISIYRKEADRSQTEFMQGQSTPYLFGITEDELPGVLGSTSLISTTSTEATAGMLEISGDGLSEMSATIEELKQTVVSQGLSLVETSQTESGKALAIRSGSKTSSLKTMMLTAAEGVTLALKYAYNWMSQGGNKASIADIDEETIRVIPNLDFKEDDNTGIADNVMKLIQAANMGFPISKQSLHAYARDKELTSMTYEEELDEINGDMAMSTPTPPSMEDEVDEIG